MDNESLLTFSVPNAITATLMVAVVYVVVVLLVRLVRSRRTVTAPEV